MISIISKALYDMYPAHDVGHNGEVTTVPWEDFEYKSSLDQTAASILEALDEAGYIVAPKTYYGEGPGGPNPSKAGFGLEQGPVTSKNHTP